MTYQVFVNIVVFYIRTVVFERAHVENKTDCSIIFSRMLSRYGSLCVLSQQFIQYYSCHFHIFSDAYSVSKQKLNLPPL